MKEKDREILESLIRDHEDLIGSSRVTMLAIESLIKSIQELKCRADDVRELYADLAESIKNTKPKVVPLIHVIEEFETEMQDGFGGDIDEIKKKAEKILMQQYNKVKSKVGKVIEHGMQLINDGDVIIVHTVSKDVTNMLMIAKEVFQKEFEVILLKQDFMKTGKLIKSFASAEIVTRVAPEYSLSHYVHEANKVFIGTLSVGTDMKFVAALGTANIISLCHLQQLPVYLFATTLKFSHQRISEQKIHRKEELRRQDNCDYVLITHSHDIVDMDLVDYIITENGVHTVAELERVIQSRDQ